MSTFPHHVRFSREFSVQFKGIFGDNAPRRAPIDLGSSPEVQEKSTPQNPPENFVLPFSHFPLYFPKVDFDGKSRVVELPMSINEGLAGLHGSREYSQSVPRAISV